VPMADFRALLVELGCTSVRTILNSGNAVFESSSRSTSKLAAGIAAAVQGRLGVTTPVVVKSAAEFAAIVQENPITPAEAEYSRFLVAFASDRAGIEALRSLQPMLQSGERLLVTEHAAYLHCAGGLLESKAGSAILGKVGRSVTTRNWGTTIKLYNLLGDSAA